ncbi:MAG: DUF1887 family CARF protein [Candidatus Cloacimonetes bacterium]|nr:DUF1887 family CARF protein [Candidatus Cloacimonadota bacterium]
MRILVSLISEQSIPNILVIKSLPNVSRYLFLCSKRMKDSGRLADLCEVCAIEDYDEICIAEHDFADVKSGLQNAVDSYPKDVSYIVNITGGTKIMALAVYDLMSHLRTQILYLPPLADSAVLIYPSAIKDFLPITHQLDAIAFLRAYGILCSYEEAPEMPYTESLFNFIARSGDPILNQWINQIGSQTEDASLRKKYLKPIGNLLGKAQAWQPDEAERKYLKGAWFEAYLAHWLQELLPQCRIYQNLAINRGGSDNELDLVFCHKNSLYVMEVKTATPKTQDIKDFLYKLDSLGKKFGLYPRRCLAIADILSEHKLRRSPYVLNRAEEMGITIFSHTELRPENIRETLTTWITI